MNVMINKLSEQCLFAPMSCRHMRSPNMLLYAFTYEKQTSIARSPFSESAGLRLEADILPWSWMDEYIQILRRKS